MSTQKVSKIGLSLEDGVSVDPGSYELTRNQFLASSRSEFQMPSESRVTFQYIALEIVYRINRILNEGNSLSEEAIKKEIIEHSRIGDYKIFHSRSFNHLTKESLILKKEDADYWYRRVLGGIRGQLFPLMNRSEISSAFKNLINDPELLLKIQGPDGYRRVAQLFCGGAMQKAYQLMSAVTKVEGVNFDDLKWGNRFDGSTEEFDALES